MSGYTVRRRRTGWDVILGLLLVVAGAIVLGNTIFATVISVLFLGWVALLSGVVGLVMAVARIGRDGFWSAALTGGLLLVLGLVFLRNPVAAALTLTLLAGSLFLVSGIVRLVAAFESKAHRVPLLVGGGASTILGLIVLFHVWESTLKLLGVLLGVQLLVDGVVTVLSGRVRVERSRGR